MRITLPNDFTPRPYQLRYMNYFDQGGRWAFWCVHRRGGKDLTAMHTTCRQAHKRKGVYWHIFPSFAQARKAIWEGFTKDGKRIMENVFPGFMDPKGPRSIVKRKDEQQMMLELKCGSIWRLLGSDRIEVVGAGPVGVTFSEYALSNPRAWNLIRPMLRENEGWAAFVTTPRGRNHAKELFDLAAVDPLWFCETQTLFDTRAYDPDKTIEEERASGMPEALIKQEYLCDWNAALVGSVWGELINQIEMQGGVSSFEHGLDGVFTSWDLGSTDSTVIWFWRITDDGVEIIDHYEAHGQPLSHYFDHVDSRPYKYVRHWLPHDARQTTLAAGTSILSQCLRKWPGKVTIGPDLTIPDGIQAGRWLLQQNVKFHSRCKEGIEALRQYHYDYDESKKVYKNTPAHDWTSHTADAFRYLAAVVKVSEMLRPRVVVPPPPPVFAKPIDRSVTLDELFQERERGMGRRRRIG